MNVRLLSLAGVMVALGLLYAIFFTEWIRPEPIQISSQVRASILQPKFGRTNAVVRRVSTNAPPAKFDGATPPKGPMVPGTNVMLRTNLPASTNQPQRVRLPNWGTIEQNPGGVANVTFALDRAYVLTSLRVEDVPADGSPPTVVWQLQGKSQPTSSILYGRDPAGLGPMKPGEKAQPLVAGVPYRLVIEAGRRRGTNHFRTRLPLVR